MNLLGTLLHRLACVSPAQIAHILFLMISIIVLMVLHRRWWEDEKKLKIWRWLSFLPLLVCLIQFLFDGLGGLWYYTLLTYLPLYLIALLPPVMALLCRKKRAPIILPTLVTIGVSLYALFIMSPIRNFSLLSYTDAFRKLVDDVEQHYILADWKALDFDALEEEFLPQVQKAEETGDSVLYLETLIRFSARFHDGHVVASTMHTNNLLAVFDQFYGNDYGLSMVQLSDGKVIAIMTEDGLEGITDGTELLAWDGVPMEEALAALDCAVIAPVERNEILLKPFYLAGQGGDSVTVTYRNAQGEPCEVVLPKLGSYTERFQETVSCFNGTNVYEENFSARMLTDTIGYLNVTKEEYNFYDEIAYVTGIHPPAQRMFKEKLDGLKAEGMQQLVIDLRNNAGGYQEISTALVSLFNPEKRYGFSLGYRKDGAFVRTADHFLAAEGSYADMPVVVLTNMQCASGGDGAAYYLSQLPNVTLMGISDPNGCNQEGGGTCLLPDGNLFFYPTGVVLDAQGNPNIDTAADRISRNPVEHRIPLTYDAAMQMFQEGEDYERDYAIAWLEEMQ